MADQTPNVGSQPTSKPSTPNVTPGSGPTTSSSASASSARPYVPQFSAATQLILQRLKAKEGKNDGSSSLGSVVSSKTTVITGSSHIKVEQDAFEDAKKRLVAGTGIKTSTSMSLKMPLVQPSIKMPTPAPTTTVKKNLSLPSASTVPRAASGSGSNSTTLSLPLPPPPPPPPQKHKSLTFKSGTTSAIKNINSGLTASGKVSVVKPPKPPAAAAAAAESKSKKAKTSTGNPVGRPPNVSKAAAAAAESSAATTNTTTGGGHRRKRIKQQQDADEFSSLSSLSDVSELEDAAAATSTLSGAAATTQTSLLTMTKSGRQVLKPTTYNPAAVDAANKKHRSTASTHHYGKRTAEQALCKKCTRMHSPAQNPMVFCDGCNEGWHQRCHDPRIETEVIRDPTKGWVCSLCVAKREGGGNKGGLGTKKGQQQRRELLEQQQQAKVVATRESWADKPPQQKRAYLSTLPPQELVGLIMAALEVKPDLPIFPGSSPGGTSTSKGSNNNNNNNNSNGKGHKGSSGPNGKSLKDVILSRETSQENQGGEEGDEEEYDPLVALWPEPGKGLYSTLPFDVDDDDYMVDNGDFEAFSSIVYDDRGRKVLENGLRV